MIKTIIFDFDGVLANSLDAATSIVNIIGSRYGLPPITRDDIRNVGVSGLLKKHNISTFKLFFFAREAKTRMNKVIESVEITPGIKPVLEQLASTYKLGILSSNSQINITPFLKKHALDEFFSFIHSDSSLFGKDKSLIRACKKEGLNIDEIVYIGDEARDIKAAKKVGATIIAALWGYEAEHILTPLEPNYLAKIPQDLLDITSSFAP